MALNLNQNAQNAQNAHGAHEIRMIYDDLCSEFAEIVVFKAIQSFTDVRIGHLPSSSSNSNAWSTALCTK